MKRYFLVLVLTLFVININAQYNRDIDGVFVNTQINDTIILIKQDRNLNLTLGNHTESTLVKSVDFKSYGVYLFFRFNNRDKVLLLYKENTNKIGLVTDITINQYGRPVMKSTFYYKL